MSTILPPDPNKPVRSAFWYCANGNLYALGVCGVLLALNLYFRPLSEYREGSAAAIGFAGLFVNFWWFAKKGMDQRG